MKIYWENCAGCPHRPLLVDWSDACQQIEDVFAGQNDFSVIPGSLYCGGFHRVESRGNVQLGICQARAVAPVVQRLVHDAGAAKLSETLVVSEPPLSGQHLVRWLLTNG